MEPVGTGGGAPPDPSLWNADLAPVPEAERTWSKWHVASLWVGMAVCIPTYMLAGDMIGAGMSVAQAIFTVALGNLIVLVPMILNAHAGTAYGIPFPVFARASFGVRGANVPALLRALVACGWFGIQTWIGGQSLHVILIKLGAGDTGPIAVLDITGLQLACFLAFWALNVYFIVAGMDSIKWLETLAAPLLILGGLALLLWARTSAGGFGPIFAQPGLPAGEFGHVFWPFLTGMVGFWATLALNIPDFSRYCRSQRDQVIGQTLGLPPTMTLFSFIGVAVTSATPLIFHGTVIKNPSDLIARFSSPAVVIIGLFGITIATLSTNIAANVVSPANDFANLAPGKISYRTGGLITAAIGLVIMPWKLLGAKYVFAWLNGYGALLGPIGGILVADYWLVRKKHLVVDDLYRRGGIYEYANGVNPVAIVAMVVGVAPNVPGFLHAVGAWPTCPQFFVTLYHWTWFTGFLLAGAITYAGATWTSTATKTSRR